jgi:hypothetical protein
MSDSTATVDITTKKDLYERTFKTPDYFVYDPFDPDALQGWHLDLDEGYREIAANEQGWLWCQRLGLWLGTWQGTIDTEEAVWLRFYDQEGNLVPYRKKQLNNRLRQLNNRLRRLNNVLMSLNNALR